MRSSGKRIVITGASSGMGAATALAFARNGGHLVLGARGKEGLEDIARRCREAGGSAEARVVDVTDAAAVAAFANEARDILGEIDLWFSCVGIGVIGKYLDVPIADHRQVIETNLVGHINDAHAVMPIFVAQDHGIWVNMISAGGFIATPYAAAYAASKFGLRGLSEALRAELSDKPHIHVCDVHPTAVDTPAIFHAANYTGAKLSYPPRSMTPEKVADAVVKLARRPRKTTAVGAPAILLRFSQFAMPNLGAFAMNKFMGVWAKRAERTSDTVGTIYQPSSSESRTRSGTQQHDQGSNTALIVGVIAAATLLSAVLRRRRFRIR